jgi:hypothetical protein
LRASDWLARFRLSASSAQLETARGNDAIARQHLIAVMADAQRVGCVICQTEIRTVLSKSPSTK